MVRKQTQPVNEAQKIGKNTVSVTENIMFLKKIIKSIVGLPARTLIKALSLKRKQAFFQFHPHHLTN